MSSRNSFTPGLATSMVERSTESIISLPPGPHGIRFRKDSSPPEISEISETCPVADRVKVGNTITGIVLPDKTMLTDLTSSDLVRELRNHHEDSGRKILVTETVIEKFDVEAGTEINKDMVDATELTAQPSPAQHTPLTSPLDSRILQAVTFVFILLGFFLSISGTASCRYVNVQPSIDVGIDFGVLIPNYKAPGYGIFRSDLGSASELVGSSQCIKNDIGEDFVLYVAQAGAIISILLATPVVILVGYSLFDPSKWYKMCNVVLLVFATVTALLTFTMFASCACGGVCVDAENIADNVQTGNLFSCGLDSGANQFITVAVFYTIASVMFCFIDRPAEPLIPLGCCCNK